MNEIMQNFIDIYPYVTCVFAGMILQQNPETPKTLKETVYSILKVWLALIWPVLLVLALLFKTEKRA